MAKKIQNKFDYVPSKRELKAMSRCNDNRITVYPVPVGSLCTITVMKANGYKQNGKQTFANNTSEWCKKIFELYLILETRI